jgi:hypothetical protein
LTSWFLLVKSTLPSRSEGVSKTRGAFPGQKTEVRVEILRLTSEGTTMGGTGHEDDSDEINCVLSVS